MSAMQPAFEPTTSSGWRSIYKIATYTTIIMLLLIPLQIVIYMVSPLPQPLKVFLHYIKEIGY